MAKISVLGAGILAVFRHRANILRLIKGTESKIFLGKAGKKKE